MTKNQKRLRELLDRQSQERQRMAEIAGLDSLTPEVRSELDTLEQGTPDLERQIRAARSALDADEAEAVLRGQQHREDDPEKRERDALRERVSIGRFLAAGIMGRRVDGAEEEFRQAAGCEERSIPLDAFEVEADRPAPETRAVTGAPSTIGVNMTALVPSVFARSTADFLGIAMPRVPSGQYSVPRITTDLTAGTQEKGGAQAATAAAFTIASTKPHRISAALSLQAEDLAEAGVPAFEASLRDNLRMVLADALDLQLLSGDNSGGNINGLATQLTDDTADSNAVTFATAASGLAGYLEGKHAHMLADLRVLHHHSVYGFLAALFASNDDSVSHLDWCARHGIRVVGNANMAAQASNVGDSIVVRGGAARGMAGAAAACPAWGDIAISDPYTEASKATHSVYLHILLGDVLIRYPAAFAQWKVKTA